jgi:general stress protein CsbA
MAENDADGKAKQWATQSSKALVSFGVAATVLTGVLAVRMVWEETSLTIQEGPQMVGFSLAHGPGVVLLFAPITLVIWIATAIVVLLIGLLRKKKLSRWYWLSLGSAIAVIGILSIPAVFWQWLMIGSFAKSPHAADLMVYDAAEGDVLTVRGYLAHGVPLTATNYEGSTATFGAAAGGSLAVIEMLTSRGADLNATNLYGDSPLEAAIGNKHVAIASFLKAHGASQIKGTPEQRDAASKSIVRKDIERMNSR